MMRLECDAIVFDCDGVILDSNRLKSDAFALALEGFDPDAVERFVEWHKATGGVSRFEKFRTFFTQYVAVDDSETAIAEALDRFGTIVFEGLIACDYIAGVEAVFAQARKQGIPSSVNTGGAEEEVRCVFANRGIDCHFETILGSPETKHSNMLKLQNSGLLGKRGIYFGDSRLDFELAMEFQQQFVYISGRSEWQNAERSLVKSNSITVENFLQVELIRI